MAAKLYDLQIAGFTQAGTPATGAGLLGAKAVEYWSDGTIIFTDSVGNRRKVHDNPDLNALLEQLLKGASGIDTAKKFHK